MEKLIKISLILITAFSPLLLRGGEIRDKAETTIRAEFNKKVRLEFQKLELPPGVKTEIENEVKQRFFMKQVYLWKVFRNDSLIAYALLDNVRGKSLPITFMVLFNNRATIHSSHIIKYREPVGGAVGNRRWQAQFEGKNAESGYQVGKQIDGISGATISVHAISKGVRKLALLAQYLVSDTLFSVTGGTE